jgi:hypothetical protein
MNKISREENGIRFDVAVDVIHYLPRVKNRKVLG